MIVPLALPRPRVLAYEVVTLVAVLLITDQLFAITGHDDSQILTPQQKLKNLDFVLKFLLPCELIVGMIGSLVTQFFFGRFERELVTQYLLLFVDMNLTSLATEAIMLPIVLLIQIVGVIAVRLFSLEASFSQPLSRYLGWTGTIIFERTVVSGCVSSIVFLSLALYYVVFIRNRRWAELELEEQVMIILISIIGMISFTQMAVLYHLYLSL